MTNNKTGYELFLPAIAAAIASKKKDNEQLSEPELRSLVAVTFRDAVIEFMQDSLLYRISLPIDLYQDVKRYDIVPPEGFLVEDVVRFESNKTNVPKLNHNQHSIWLACCPTRDIHRAFYVVAALVAKRSKNCKFDDNFLERYYEVILANMFTKITAMQNRVWRSLGSTLRYRRDYINKLAQAKRRDLNGGDILRIKTRRLTHGT